MKIKVYEKNNLVGESLVKVRTEVDQLIDVSRVEGSFDLLQEIFDRQKEKCYSTLGDAFEDVFYDWLQSEGLNEFQLSRLQVIAEYQK